MVTFAQIFPHASVNKALGILMQMQVWFHSDGSQSKLTGRSKPTKPPVPNSFGVLLFLSFFASMVKFEILFGLFSVVFSWFYQHFLSVTPGLSFLIIHSCLQ